MLEVVGGALLVFELFTRPVAFILYWMGHAPRSVLPLLNGGDASIPYSFLFLYLVAAGPGAFSLEQRARDTARAATVRVTAH